MQRVTISIDESLGASLDQMAADRQYSSRSKAVRDLVRDGLERWRLEGSNGGYCVANLSYVVDRRIRALPRRITELQHAHHDLIAAGTVVRLDHFSSLETVILKGQTAAVRAFADEVRAQRGIRFGAINLFVVSSGERQHASGDHVHDSREHLSPPG